MLRVVLLGLLSVSAVACKSQSESSAKAQPGVAAGKVLEVKGAVTVKRADATHSLAVGESVEGDDIVITGADGSVVIELAHNAARWELGANKQQKVRESIAWNATKATAEPSQEATAAAGRPAERNAAGTSVTAGEPPPPPATESETEPAPTPMPSSKKAKDRSEPAPVERRRERTPAKVASPSPPPPPPPPPPPKATMAAPTDSDAPRPTRGGGGSKSAGSIGVEGSGPGGGGTESAKADTTDKGAPPATPTAPKPATQPVANPLAAKRAQLHGCMTDHKDAVTLTVAGTSASYTVKVTSKTAVSAELDACMKRVVSTITFASGTSFPLSLTIEP